MTSNVASSFSTRMHFLRSLKNARTHAYNSPFQAYANRHQVVDRHGWRNGDPHCRHRSSHRGWKGSRPELVRRLLSVRIQARLQLTQLVCRFIVQLRSLVDGTLMPGVTCGDIGAKMGRAGYVMLVSTSTMFAANVGTRSLDNGWIQFTQVRIPLENMLMKWAQLSPDVRFLLLLALSLPKSLDRSRLFCE